jgi:hypothetical protein
MKATIRGTEIYFDVAGMEVEPKKDMLIEKPVLFLIHGGPGGNHLHFKSDLSHCKMLLSLFLLINAVVVGARRQKIQIIH